MSHTDLIFRNKQLYLYFSSEKGRQCLTSQDIFLRTEKISLLIKEKQQLHTLKYDIMTLDEHQLRVILIIETAYDVPESAVCQLRCAHYNKHHMKHRPHNGAIICFQH